MLSSSRPTRQKHLVLVGLLLALLAPAAGAAEGETVAPVIWMPAMNVFRRHAVPSEKMFHFYGDVLGFEQLQTFAVGNGGVARFKAGASELKLTGRVERRSYVAGGVSDATGLRLLSFFFPDQGILEARFAANGLAVPEFRKLDGRNSALVQDPDGQWVELVIVPGESDEFYRQVEVGLTVSDMEKSRDFYGNFVGLEAMKPVHDPLFDTMKYSYRNGATIVSLRGFGDSLPADTGSGGIQYVVSDVVRVDALAKEREIAIDQPLSELAGFTLRTIWLDDPDGITNYFAQTGESGRAAQ